MRLRTALTVALIASAAALAGCTGTPAEVAGPSPSASPSPATVSPAAPSPSPSPSDTTWRPCKVTIIYDSRGCKSFNEDSCDGAFNSQELGSLLDSFIEDRIFVDPERLKACPQFLPTWQQSLTGFTDGVNLVPSEVAYGTYETTAHLIGGRIVDCYWERSANGDIRDNNFVSGAPKLRVTIRKGDDAFTSRGCGNWVKVG